MPPASNLWAQARIDMALARIPHARFVDCYPVPSQSPGILPWVDVELIHSAQDVTLENVENYAASPLGICAAI